MHAVLYTRKSPGVASEAWERGESLGGIWTSQASLASSTGRDRVRHHCHAAVG